MKRGKWVLIVLGVIIVSVVLVYNYVYQDHRDIASEEPAFSIAASEISNAFQEDEVAATEKYLNKTVLVEGILSDVDQESIVVEPGIFFALSENQIISKNIQVDVKVEVKGRCIGYDSLLEEVKFDQAIIKID